jgi:hypothetical protein
MGELAEEKLYVNSLLVTFEQMYFQQMKEEA